MKTPIKVNDLKHTFNYLISKVKTTAFVCFLLLSGLSVNAIAAEKAVTKEMAEARVIAIKERVNEIQAMDFSHASRAEKRDIRNELKDMNKELRQLGPTYVYISGAGLILIIILLILLL